VVEAIRRQLPPGIDPDALVFTGPGGVPGASDKPFVLVGVTGFEPVASAV